MSKGKGPSGRVPFSPAVKRSLAAVGILFGLAGAVELYMLGNPEEIAPISWAFWWMYENARWLPAFLAGVGGAFYAHFFWYLRPGNFWFPLTKKAAIIIGVGTMIPIAVVKAWYLLAFMAAFQGCAVLAHWKWFRIEKFNEHLAQFHDDEPDEHEGVGL